MNNKIVRVIVFYLTYGAADQITTAEYFKWEQQYWGDLYFLISNNAEYLTCN